MVLLVGRKKKMWEFFPVYRLWSLKGTLGLLQETYEFTYTCVYLSVYWKSQKLLIEIINWLRAYYY